MTLSGIKKRAPKLHSHVAVKQQLTGSRFVCCPLCGGNIPWHRINEHIDASHETSDEAQASKTISSSAQRCRTRVKESACIGKVTGGRDFNISHNAGSLKLSMSSSSHSHHAQTHLSQTLQQNSFGGSLLQVSPLCWHLGSKQAARS